MAPEGRWALATVLLLCLGGGCVSTIRAPGWVNANVNLHHRWRYEVFSPESGRIVRRHALDAPDFKSATALGNITNADLAALDLPESKINETLEAQNQTLTYDSSPYYDQQAADFARHWIDFPALQASKDVRVYEHPLLSQSYRRADTVTLSFRFPYYGHLVDKVTIATGGFLYLGQYVHSWLAATQYVAPLMAHFDTSSDDAAKIRYVDHGDFFAVEWSRVHLKSRSNTDDGDDDKSERQPVEQRPFTFQAILHRNGDIAFAYKEIPFEISLIEDNEHPVKVGLSDAYIMDRTIFFVRRKTIYEYHRISLPHAFVGNETAILFKALPTCNQMKTCADCLGEIVHGFQCQWCPSAFSCSDGIDRRRQEWLTLGCDHRNINESRFCDMYPKSPDDADAIVSSTSRTNVPMDGDSSNNNNENDSRDKDTPSQESHTETNGNQIHFAVTALIVILVIAVLLFLWLIYAYFCPHSWSGQLLIKYRPTRWHWLRSEPRYTAASIHM
ncbi:hypothetical protein TCAL_05909 [Tigriopus californicus]|uniref:PSI domain-containing protein n=1 Tax=Tigriopus californicus TaxID=6832 RepID=A0A553PPI7_TIGCA|nr:plexin domain-containing protein 2-like [Tigriopus californicus]TRY79597.1 hypothetical protein TCAL_05909 [Tigriopus californicus]